MPSILHKTSTLPILAVVRSRAIQASPRLAIDYLIQANISFEPSQRGGIVASEKKRAEMGVCRDTANTGFVPMVVDFGLVSSRVELGGACLLDRVSVVVYLRDEFISSLLDAILSQYLHHTHHYHYYYLVIPITITTTHYISHITHHAYYTSHITSLSNPKRPTNISLTCYPTRAPPKIIQPRRRVLGLLTAEAKLFCWPALTLPAVMGLFLSFLDRVLLLASAFQ